MTSFSDQGTQFNYDEYSKAALAEKYTHLQRLMVKEKLKTRDLGILLDNAINALKALGAKPVGYCFCISAEQVEAGHTGECRQAQAVMAVVDQD